MKCQKHLFSIPEDVTYLNAATMGVLLTKAEAAGHKAVSQKLAPWTVSSVDFFTNVNKACALIAEMISAKQDDIIIIPSASYGLTLAAHNLNIEASQKILILEDQFPSNVYPWIRMAEKIGAEVVTVKRPKNNDWTSAILEMIEQSVAIVACPTVHWTDGTKIDLIAVSQKVKSVKAALVLDLSQSLGVMPFSVRDVDPDFMVSVGYKWLLGPYSFSYAYIAPRHQGGIPIEENWIARKDSENFAALVDYKTDYQSGARRFDVGERSNFILCPIAINCLEQMLEWGANNIALYLKGLTDYAAEKSLKIGLDVSDEKIYVGVRGKNIRIAPHVYNDRADIDRLFSVITDILKGCTR